MLYRSFTSDSRRYETKFLVFALILAGVAYLCFIPNDILFITVRWMLVAAIAGRIAVFLLLCLLATGFWRQWPAHIRTWLLSLTLGTNIAVIIAIGHTRPQGYLLGFISVAVAILAIYAFVPGPPWIKLSHNLILTGLNVVKVWTEAYSEQARIVVTVTFIAINILGAVAMRTVTRLRAMEQAYLFRIEADRRYRGALAGLVSQAVLIYEEDRILYCNDRLLEWLDCRGDEILTYSLSRLLAIAPARDNDPASGNNPARLPQKPAERGTLRFGPETLEVSFRTIEVTSGKETLKGLVFQKNAPDSPGTIDIEGLLESRVSRLPLSAREKEVAVLILDGQTRYAIAERLAVSDETVKKHTKNIYAKLGVSSKAELFRIITQQ